MLSLIGRIIGSDAYPSLGAMVDDESLPIDQAVRPRIQLGKNMSDADRTELLSDMCRVKQEFDAALSGFDALLTPTTPFAAIPVASVDQTTSPAVFTRFVNLIEGCAVALPNGFTAGGLPTSLQVVCRSYQESLALRVAYAFEQATSFGRRVPPAVATSRGKTREKIVSARHGLKSRSRSRSGTR
eukprot:gnl/TRDRNA2_/TRDRNA2_148394_c1_seq1.p1 gnl/TRDRNA2_/TRDRNA2_148394_c1~~gnl/TRDRNA2_/TRDRNA2_148394_c1_seq1.p1  ORF type:complete len:185 (-),score=17.73 gnl/TRDRNA2_/TRDRNA2_148394_c1_seq1:6-560(-)